MNEDKSKEYINNLLKTNKLDWKNPPSVEDLMKDYNSASQSRGAGIKKIDNYLKLMENPKEDFGKNRSSVKPKVIKKQAEWIYSNLEDPLLSKKDLFNLEGRTFEDTEGSKHRKTIINKQFDKDISRLKLINKASRVFTDEGTLVLKVGWKRTIKKIKKITTNKVPEFKHFPMQDPNQIEIARQQGMPPYERRLSGYKDETNIEWIDKIIDNHPTLEVVDYNKITIDPKAKGDIKKAQFVIYEYDSNLSELKKSSKNYQNLDSLNIKSDENIVDENDSDEALLQAEDIDNNFDFEDNPRKTLKVYEYWGYWDVSGSGMTEPFVATYCQGVMIGLDENPLKSDRLPFVSGYFKPVKNSNYGEADAEVIEDEQETIGAMLRGIIDLFGRSANAQEARPKGFLDVVQEAKYDRGEDYEYNPIGLHPKDAMYQHQFPEIPASVFNFLNMQTNEVDSRTGRKSFSGGISGSALGSTATGIRSALDASAKRELGILRRFASVFEESSSIIVEMNDMFLTDEQILRVTNSDYLIKNRVDDFAIFDAKLSISTPEQDEMRSQKIAFMMQTMGNNLPFDFTQMMLEKEAALSNMPDLEEKIRTYEQKPDPLEEQLKQLELQIKQLEGAYLQAKIGKDQSIAGLNNVKAEMERLSGMLDKAKADNINSQTDLQDMEYVRVTEGISQQEDLQRVRENHMAQKDMVVSKGIMELEKEKMKTKAITSKPNTSVKI